MGIIAASYLNSICEIKSQKNRLLASGRLTGITDEHIRIDDQDDYITVLKYRTLVKVNLFNSKKEFKSLIGNVYISNPNFMLISDVKEIADYENRSFFRINVELIGLLTYKKDDDAAEIAVEVEIENVSLSGILFSSNCHLKEADEIAIFIELPKGNTSFSCKVCRIDYDSSALIKYGCEFLEPTDQQLDKLWHFILNKQREEIRRQKRAEIL